MQDAGWALHGSPGRCPTQTKSTADPQIPIGFNGQTRVKPEVVFVSNSPNTIAAAPGRRRPLIASEISLSPGGTRAEFSDASCHTPAQQLPCPQHSESTVKPRPNPTRLVERTKPLETTEPPHGPHPRPVHAPVALARRANPASQRPTNPASPSGRAHQNPPRRHGHEHANTKI
jgi:hypothetical protein